MTLIQPLLGCCWFVVYTRSSLSSTERNLFTSFKCHSITCLADSLVMLFNFWLPHLHLSVEPSSPYCLFWTFKPFTSLRFGTSLLPPLSISISIWQYLVSGKVWSRRSGQRHLGAELCVSVWVCLRQWDEVRGNVWPIQRPGCSAVYDFWTTSLLLISSLQHAVLPVFFDHYSLSLHS